MESYKLGYLQIYLQVVPGILKKLRTKQENEILHLKKLALIICPQVLMFLTFGKINYILFDWRQIIHATPQTHRYVMLILFNDFYC